MSTVPNGPTVGQERAVACLNETQKRALVAEFFDRRRYLVNRKAYGARDARTRNACAAWERSTRLLEDVGSASSSSAAEGAR